MVAFNESKKSTVGCYRSRVVLVLIGLGLQSLLSDILTEAHLIQVGHLQAATAPVPVCTLPNVANPHTEAGPVTTPAMRDLPYLSTSKVENSSERSSATPPSGLTRWSTSEHVFLGSQTKMWNTLILYDIWKNGLDKNRAEQV